MLSDVWFNIKYGMDHVLNIKAYDHVLFLIVLAVPYLFKDWKRVLLLVSMFTLGHSISLLLAAYNIVHVNANIVEFLIPVSILIVAVFNVFTSGKNAKKEKVGILFLSTLFFGLIHGLGFAREFHMFLNENDNKLIVLLEFALGIEMTQVIIVFIILFLGFLMQTIFRFSKRDWIMVVSSIVIGLVIPMILNSTFLS